MATQMLFIPTVVHVKHQPLGGLALFALLMLGACEPTVRLQAPSEPITINLNVKVDAEVRVKLEKQAEDDIRKNSNIF